MPKRTAIMAGAAALVSAAMGAGALLLLPDKPAEHRAERSRVANGAVVAAAAASSASMSTSTSTLTLAPGASSEAASASSGTGDRAAPSPSTRAALEGRGERSAVAELPMDRLRRRLGEVLGSRGRLTAETGGDLRIVGTAAARPTAAGSASQPAAQRQADTASR
jgi:hypothetical protein